MMCDLRALAERALVVAAAGLLGEVGLVLVVCFAVLGFAGLADVWSGLIGDAA
jgi:hypothetical protein